MKVTSVAQLEAGYPYKSVKQKIYGLEYSILVFVYEKSVNRRSKTIGLNISHVLFITPNRTADFQATIGIRDVLRNDGNKDDLTAFMFDRRLLFDATAAGKLADEILSNPPHMGFLMTSNDLRWRLKYFGMFEQAGQMQEDVLIYKA